MQTQMKLDDTLNTPLRDIISGFVGTGTAYAVYVTGCNQVCLTPKVNKDGKRQESEWFDIERIELAASFRAPPLATSPGGGPRHQSETPPTK